jgi:WD40 repeat protein
MPGHGDKMRSLVVATDGTIASGDFSGEIRLWDGGSGTGTGGSGSGTNGSEAGTGGQAGAFRKTLARQGTMVGSLSFSPDGTLLSSCGQNCRGTYGFVYDLASGREIVRYSTISSSPRRSARMGAGRRPAVSMERSTSLRKFRPCVNFAGMSGELCSTVMKKLQRASG